MNQQTPGPSSSTPVARPAASGLNTGYTGDDLLEFFKTLDEFTPVIPDSLTAHFLSQVGLNTSDPRIVRLVSLAAQKFVTDVVSDAMVHHTMRGSHGSGSSSSGGGSSNKKTKDKQKVLQIEDIQAALTDMGIDTRKPLYYL